jgi:hypothetical protein
MRSPTPLVTRISSERTMTTFLPAPTLDLDLEAPPATDSKRVALRRPKAWNSALF